MTEKTYTAADVLEALDEITGGRVIKRAQDAMSHPFVVTKTSHIPGKAITETPGLVCGAPEHTVRKLAVSMTLTESQLELAGGTGVDAIIAHHPVADAASCGGVLLRDYAELYGIAIFEAHEAFHGRHPGMALLHGHRPFRVEIAYGGVAGNIMFVGRALDEIKTIGDVIERLAVFTDLEMESQLLELERGHRDCPELMETNIAVQPVILNGDRQDKIGTVLHIFPHTGFTPAQMRQVKAEHPEIDTVIVSVSRVGPAHALVETARELGIAMLAGNSHALEILENGLPMACALRTLLPGIEIVIFRERVTSVPMEKMGSKEMREFAGQMADGFLIKK